MVNWDKCALQWKELAVKLSFQEEEDVPGSCFFKMVFVVNMEHSMGVGKVKPFKGCYWAGPLLSCRVLAGSCSPSSFPVGHLLLAALSEAEGRTTGNVWRNIYPPSLVNHIATFPIPYFACQSYVAAPANQKVTETRGGGLCNISKEGERRESPWGLGTQCTLCAKVAQAPQGPRVWVFPLGYPEVAAIFEAASATGLLTWSRDLPVAELKSSPWIIGGSWPCSIFCAKHVTCSTQVKLAHLAVSETGSPSTVLPIHM